MKDSYSDEHRKDCMDLAHPQPYTEREPPLEEHENLELNSEKRSISKIIGENQEGRGRFEGWKRKSGAETLKKILPIP